MTINGFFRLFIRKKSVIVQGSIFFHIFINVKNTFIISNDKDYFRAGGRMIVRVAISISVFCCLLFVQNSKAQTQAVFQKIDQSDGLSNGRVTSILKENSGFVWVATKNGLNRYDGQQVKVYSKQNSQIGSNDISDLLIDRQGRMWIATLGGGLNLYDRLKDDFIVHKNNPTDPASISSNYVNTIYEDSEGEIWLGTENGLCRYSPETGNFTSFRHVADSLQTISHNSVTSIYEDGSENLWVGTFGGGLNRYNKEDNTFSRIEASEGYFTDFIHAIDRLNDDSILIGTSGAGLLALNIRSLAFSNFLAENLGITQEVGIVRSLANDRDGDIWVGTDGDGVFEVRHPNDKKPETIHYSYNPQLQSSLSGNAIYDIMEDDDANIWLGTAWNGINVLNKENDFDFLFGDIKGENPAPVLSILKNEDHLLMGLDGNGLTLYEQKTNSIRTYNKNDNTSLGGNYIQFITEIGRNAYWLGTFANGLINFNAKTGTVKQYKHNPQNPQSLSYNDVRYVLDDGDGSLWIATWGGGLNHLDTKTNIFQHFREKANNDKSINSDNVISLQRDGDKIWVATFGGGLDLFDPKTFSFSHFEHSEENPNSPSSNNIFSLLKDSKGNLWVGTSGEGINRYNPKTNQFERFEERENVKYSTVTAIIEDDNGKIWFSTKQGIFNFDYATNEFKSFPSLAGEFHINSVFKDEMGLLYFGGIDGVIRFNPNTISSENNTPEVRLTNFKLFNKELPIGENQILKENIAYEEEIVLKHNLDVITFEFAALQFPFSDDCEFSIKMENFDEEWRNIGKDRTATFTNLSPGHYTFKVRSRQAGSDWGEGFTSIELQILKPFWLRWWAFLVYASLVVVLFYLFRKYIVAWEQMKANLKLEKFSHEKDTELYNLKQQFFTNISHEIRTPVTLILSSVNRLMSDKSASYLKGGNQESLAILKKNSGRLLNLVNELLDFRKLERHEIKLNVTEDDWTRFCQEIYLSFTEIAIQKKIDFSFEQPASSLNVWFDKNQMEKVVYNLLSNAFKYTNQEGTITVTVQEDADYAYLTVKDSGIGVPKKKQGKIFNRFYQSENTAFIKESGFGLGLSISKEIVELHQGRISVESEKGKGSAFTIQLLKGKAHFASEELVQDIDNGEVIENYFLEPIEDTVEIDAAPKVDLSELKGSTILVVEDNADIRNYLIELLSTECYLLEASNGKDGVDMAMEHLPDLIISDVMMPVMDGIGLTRILKSEMRTSHIPIILLTARASFMHRMEGYDTGADEYISKPFNEALLRSRIKNLIRNRQLVRDRFNTESILEPSEIAVNPTDRRFLEKLLNCVEENMDSDELSANFISKELGMSHSVIYKKTKAMTGMTFVEFVRDYKLMAAKRLIAEEQFSIAEACYKVGYSDKKYFSKLFKQKFGKNPSDFYSRN